MPGSELPEVAAEIARWLGAPAVHCEHLLIAALRAPDADDSHHLAAARALAELGTDSDDRRHSTDCDLALSDDARRVLDLADMAARRRGRKTADHLDVVAALREFRETTSYELLSAAGLAADDSAAEGLDFDALGASAPATETDGAFAALGPLAALANAGVILARPDDDPGRPWVIARGDLVVKAYDLSAPGVDPARRRTEGELAVHLSDLEGVVRARQVRELDDWLLIEMDRAAEGLDRHLQDVAAGRRPPLGAAAYGQLLAGVASTLQALAGRGLVHRDIKPANLLFDRERRRLLVADFSISGPVPAARRGRPAPAGEPMGTDRYIAPEQFTGVMTAAVDQYSLGVTALDVFAHTERSTELQRVLARATAQRPADRYARIAEFGSALLLATDDQAPQQWSDRLERVKPQWRHAWAPGLLAALLVYVALFLIALPRHPSPDRVLAVPLVGLIVAAFVRAGQRGGSRSRPRLAIADQVWFAPALALPMVALVLAVHPNSDLRTFLKNAVPLIALAYGATLWLGSTPPDAGAWLIGLCRRWERRRHRGRVVSAGALLAIGTVLSLFIALPLLAYRTVGSRSATRVAYVELIARFRADLLGGEPGQACRLLAARTLVVRPCSDWLAQARSTLLGDLAQSDRRDFLGVASLASFTVASDSGGDDPGVDITSESNGRSVGFGTFTTPTVIDVQLFRPLNGQDGRLSVWTYEAQRTDRGWELTGVSACANSTRADCDYFTSPQR